MDDGLKIAFVLMMGFSLAATCGLRAFLPLLIIGIAGKTGLVELSQNFEWMMSWPAIACFGCATVLEILADKIPAVDHILDAAGVVIRPVAGAIAASSLITHMDPLFAMVIGIIMGASIAGVMQTVKGALRVLSTAATGGIANPAISVAEDTATAATGIVALIVPALSVIIIIAGLFFSARFVLRGLKRRKQAP